MKSDMKYPAFAHRLTKVWKACKSAPEKQTPLAKWLGFSQPTVNDWLNGKGLPSMDTALKLADRFDCNVEWLLTGKGSVYVGEEISDPLYAEIRSLSPEHRAIIESTIAALNKTQNKPLTLDDKNVGGGR